MSSADFDRVRAAKNRAHSPLFILEAAPNDHGQARLGLVVAKKTAQGKSVTRNRIRRRLREALRLIHLSTPLPPLDIVLIAKSADLADYRFAQLTRDLQAMLRKIENKTGKMTRYYEKKRDDLTPDRPDRPEPERV